jgi:uncharacterized alpha-E superfamily protein
LSSLLARFAENGFWIARYIERSEHLARIIEVNETFARDAHGSKDWLPILRLHSDEERFYERYKSADAASVVRFYMIDAHNANSIVSSIRAARENARSIRHLVSLETWVQLNVFYNWVKELKPRNLKLTELSRLCAAIKEGCQLHSGIVNGTLYRDQIWSFYRLGVFMELCDQITRLVDMKYHSLLPSWQDVGTSVDIAQWNALLRSASAYHGYRRVFPREMTPTTVAGFILLDSRFPRSITHCVRNIELVLGELLHHPELSEVSFRSTALESLKQMASRTAQDVVGSGLHEYLDEVQLLLLSLGNDIASQFFAAEAASSA